MMMSIAIKLRAFWGCVIKTILEIRGVIYLGFGVNSVRLEDLRFSVLFRIVLIEVEIFDGASFLAMGESRSAIFDMALKRRYSHLSYSFIVVKP